MSGGLTDWQEQCNYFHKVLSCPYVVITQGGDGVVGKMEGKFFEYRPQRAVQPESVIGAGDCFVAFLGMALGYGMTPRKAVSVAWEAGCIYVQRKHNKPVEPYDLMKTYDIVGAKCVQPESLVNRDFKLIFTNGCFDICHSGHLSLLRYCKSIGHKVVVAINSDQSIKNLKGSYRPIVPLAQRMEMLAHLECVDFVVSFDENDPTNVIQIIKPDILVKGGDYSPETVVGSDLVKDVRIFPLVPGQSTTGIIEKIQFQHSNPI